MKFLAYTEERNEVVKRQSKKRKQFGYRVSFDRACAGMRFGRSSGNRRKHFPYCSSQATNVYTKKRKQHQLSKYVKLIYRSSNVEKITIGM